MAGGNRGTGGAGTEVVYLRLPVEMIYVIKTYQTAIRAQSVNEAVRRLLESHPDIIALAVRMAYNERDTSPQPNSKDTPS